MKYNDNTLKDIIMKRYDLNNLHELSVEERVNIIHSMLSDTDASVRQLSRVLGVDRKGVNRVRRR